MYLLFLFTNNSISSLIEELPSSESLSVYFSSLALELRILVHTLFFYVLLFLLVLFLFLQSIFMLGRSVSSCPCSSNFLKRSATSNVLRFCDSLMVVTLGSRSLPRHHKTLLTTSSFGKVLPSVT